MKTFKLFSIIVTCLMITSAGFAQKERSESFKVSGECNMCKKKIEKAAKQAGATHASWSPTTKILEVTYDASASSVAAIQQTIAGIGYDTPLYKAPEDAYKGLDECCQYERKTTTAQCCDNKKCERKDGQCSNPAICKDKGCGDMSCCKKS